MLFKLLGRFLVAGCWVTAVVHGVSWIWLGLLGVQFFLLPGLLGHIQPPKLSVASIPYLERIVELSGTAEHRDVMQDTEGGMVAEHIHPGAVTLMENVGEEMKNEEEEMEAEMEEVNHMEENAVYEELSLLALRDFYGSQVCLERTEAPQELCDLVQGLMELLLRRIRAFGPCCQSALRGRCVGVGSMFEGWGVNRGQQIPIYDLLVPFSAPEGLRLEVELQFEQQSSTEGTQDGVRFTATPPPPELQGTACVDVKAVPEVPRARSFGSRSRLEDFVPRVRSERMREGLDYLLEECFAIDQQMEPERVLVWLGAVLRRVWMFRGGAKLSFWGQGNPCVMRLQTTSGKVLYINATPAVRIPDSDLYVVARAGPGFAAGSGRWETWFCSDEEFYLRRVARSLPLSSCHLVCLEILTYLNRPSTPFSPRAVTFLSSYHLKTALLHLLHTHTDADSHTHTCPQLWDGPCLMERLEEMMLFMQTCISQRRLLSFWVGNHALGDRGPALVGSAAPLNLFWGLEEAAWAKLAQQELRRLSLRLHCLPTGAALSRLLPLQVRKADRKRSSTSSRRAGLHTPNLQAFTKTQARTHAHTLRAVTQRLSQATVRRGSLNPHSEVMLHQDSNSHAAEARLGTEAREEILHNE